MPAYLGTKEIEKCYLGTKELDVSYLGTTEVCSEVDDGEVHFPYATQYYLQAFKSTGRIIGKTKVIQLFDFALRHEDGRYVLNKYHLQDTSRNGIISLNIGSTGDAGGIIRYASERCEVGSTAATESVEEFDLYDRSTSPYTYIGTAHYTPWEIGGTYQMPSWDRVNEFHPEKPSNKFRMEVYTAHSFSDTYKLYFPRMWFKDMNGANISMTGMDAYSTPQDSGSSVSNLFDGRITTHYNSVNTSKMIVLCFRTSDNVPRTLGNCTIMSPKDAYDQVPATFRISACDSQYNPMWEMAMVKEPIWKKYFTTKQWDLKVWPARLVGTNSVG